MPTFYDKLERCYRTEDDRGQVSGYYATQAAAEAALAALAPPDNTLIAPAALIDEPIEIACVPAVPPAIACLGEIVDPERAHINAVPTDVDDRARLAKLFEEGLANWQEPQHWGNEVPGERYALWLWPHQWLGTQPE